MRLADEAEAVVRQLRQPVRKTVTIGANEPSVQALLPIIAECCQRETDIGFDVRRTQARRVGAEALAGTLDFGVLVSQDVALGLQTGTIGLDELEVLLYPSHPLAGRDASRWKSSTSRSSWCTTMLRRPVGVPLGDVLQPWALRLAVQRDAELSPLARMVLDVAGAIARRTIETVPKHSVGVKVVRASRSKSQE